MDVFEECLDSITNKNINKKSIMENLQRIILLVDEMIDEGIVINTDTDNLENKIPTLILAGTKGCADLIVKAISMFPIKSLDSLIDESEIFDTKKHLNNYKNLLKEAEENLEFIIKNQSKKYLHISGDFFQTHYLKC